jgi:hypothetical protein
MATKTPVILDGKALLRRLGWAVLWYALAPALMVALLYWREGLAFCAGVFVCGFLATLAGMALVL